MKKKTILFGSLCSLALILAGCENNPDSSSDINSSSVSSDGSSSSASSSGSEEIKKEWNAEQIAFLNTYCGEILPYPSLLNGEVTFMELNNGGSKYLAILNKSETFTLKSYATELKNKGWEVKKDYKGNEYQYYDGNSYYELTKDGKENGYEIMYYHSNVELNNEVALYNVIICHNGFSYEKRKETSWNDKDKEAIEYVTTRDIPYFALGKDYSLYNTNEDTLVMFDYLTKDLTKEIAAVLENDGYIYSNVLSSRNNAYTVIKSFSDGTDIEIAIRYYQGNNVYVYFTPKVTAYSSWPSSFLSSLEEKTGTAIPSFPISEGGNYLTYIKHGTYYLYTVNLLSGFDYTKYLDNVTSKLFCWDEKLSLQAYILRDDEDNDTGFIMYLKEGNPSSTFSSSWPKDDLPTALKETIEVEGVDIPALDLSSLNIEHDIKYVKVTQKDFDECYAYYLAMFTYQYSDSFSKEEIEALAWDYAQIKARKGVTISVYDVKCKEQKDSVTRYEVNEAYKEALYNAGWYLVPESGGCKYEDPTGSLLIEVKNTPYSDYGYTSIYISKGSGEAHTPEFRFGKESYELSIGNKLTLQLNQNMLPYEVTYSSSDTSIANVSSSGVVTLTSSAAAGDKVTITAKCNDKDGKEYAATCSITVVKEVSYSTILDDINDLLVNLGYDSSTFTRENVISPGKKVIGERLTVNMGSSKTKDEIKSLVLDSLIPENFVKGKWENYSTDDAYRLKDEISDITKLMAKSSASDKECLYCYWQSDSTRFTLRYFVYTDTNGDIILYIESSNY